MAYKRSRKDFEADLQKQESPFVFYGTPLPPLDEHARDDGSYVPVWKQEVTDDRGRKRLHGAFTGGFSAGYFNTVGSKEGWTPATFVSSRTSRANTQSQTQQRPEDFMDEEDMREQEESRNLSASEGFAGFGTADDTNHKNALIDLLRPSEDTMGVKLLNKMGWKLGQGIGPKVKRKADFEGDAGEVRLFAPEDVSMLVFNRKTDDKGLGYTGSDSKIGSSSRITTTRVNPRAESDEEDGDGRPGLSFATRAKTSSKIKRSAFGVGILNDTGSDDEDPYSMGPKIAYNKSLGADKKPKKNKILSNSNANPTLSNTPVFVSRKISSIANALRKCHDGRLPLTGFVLADELDNFSTMSIDDDKYKPPPVPESWHSSLSTDSNSPSESTVYRSTAEAAKSSEHTSSTRGNLLGETALPGKSIFDYLTPAAREKLMKVTGKTNLPPALSEPLPKSKTAASHPQPSQIPHIDSQTALQALSRLLNGGFTPYGDDAAKAARYRTYLEAEANGQADTEANGATRQPAPRPPTMTQEDYMTELHEFARAVEVFKPVSGLIASRFTTSTSNSTRPSQSSEPQQKDPILGDLLTKPASRPADPAEDAAKVGMFGPLTRSFSNFYPTRLLCKRFGVSMPNHTDIPQDARVGTTGDGTTAPTAAATSRFQSGGFHHDERGATVSESQKHSSASSMNGQQLAIEAPGSSASEVLRLNVEVDPDKNEALEQERPGAAVFRAIFGSDDEDEDD